MKIKIVTAAVLGLLQLQHLQHQQSMVRLMPVLIIYQKKMQRLEIKMFGKLAQIVRSLGLKAMKTH